MADRLTVTELDFDTIKNNLKAFLKQQNQFTDYDFEGSGLSILLDTLAYNTHYNAYYLNMVANEAFLDTALLRDSVVSHAKTLNYTPYSKKSSVARINLTAISEDQSSDRLTLPVGFRFLSNQIDGKVYNFVVLNDVTVTKSGNSFYFENLDINEGQLLTYTFVHDEGSNPKQIFTLPDENLDTDTIFVGVSPTTGNTQISVYEKVTDVTEATANSEVYFLQEHRSGKYQIYFGNNVLGKKLQDGSVVTVRYLVTNGQFANKANNFVPAISATTDNLETVTNFIVDPLIPANGGYDREDVDRIKYSAPLQFVSQNRIVTQKDYEVYVRKNYPNIDSISIWGGEDEVPPIYGKVFISIKPSDDYFISEAEKDRIIEEIINPRSMVTVQTEFRDPELLYLNVATTVQYDPKKTTLRQDAFRNSIRNAVVFYKNFFLDKFNARFTISKLQESIDAVDLNSIVGSEMTVRVQKRFLPQFGRNSNYKVGFNVPLLQGTTFNKISSSQFDVNDRNGIRRKVFLEEVPKSFTGINSINVVNPGVNYTSTPTVTITGDGFGATARAVLELGRIQRIEITNPGIDYNKAVVTISGGGGFGATAVAIINTNVGKLRTVYYTESAERVIVNSDAGDVNYETGVITLSDINILSSDTPDNLLRIDSGLQTNIIQSNRNTILTIDSEEPSSIVINLLPI